MLNAPKLASNLSVTSPTIGTYVDLMVDLLLVHRLKPFHGNTKKRLVKSPRLYVRDSGLLHALLGLEDYEALFGYPVVGASWEGFVIENLLAVASRGTRARVVNSGEERYPVAENVEATGLREMAAIIADS